MMPDVLHATIGIPYYVMNFKQEFQKNVIDYFAEEYLHGRTPNPCIACNRYVKWEVSSYREVFQLEQIILQQDIMQELISLRTEDMRSGSSATLAKDQTYALYNLTQEQLEHTLMPVGNYSKDQIREMAEKIGLQVANKPDSQDICFVPDGDYASFIEENADAHDSSGKFRNIGWEDPWKTQRNHSLYSRTA